MAKYLVVVKPHLREFLDVKIEQVGIDMNSHANALAGVASIFEGKND